MPKMSLSEAGAVLGVSANAVRARAKKSPEKYKLERDNAGKLWVDVDLQNVSELKPSRPGREGSTVKPVKPSNEVEIARLTVEVQAANRARDQAEAERDHWRRMAETLAAKRWRFWPFSS
jgi:hypothetical protein